MYPEGRPEGLSGGHMPGVYASECLGMGGLALLYALGGASELAQGYLVFLFILVCAAPRGNRGKGPPHSPAPLPPQPCTPPTALQPHPGLHPPHSPSAAP